MSTHVLHADMTLNTQPAPEPPASRSITVHGEAEAVLQPDCASLTVTITRYQHITRAQCILCTYLI